MSQNLDKFIAANLNALKPDQGVKCDFHPSRPAVAQFAGEQDSFGTEYTHCCQECVDGHKARLAEIFADPTIAGESYCEHCGKDHPNFFHIKVGEEEVLTRNFRFQKDYESSSVEYMCHSCRKAVNAEALADCEEYDREQEALDDFDDN